MYSLLLPSCFCDHQTASLAPAVAWQRRSVNPWSALRAACLGAGSAWLRAGDTDDHAKWSLV